MSSYFPGTFFPPTYFPPTYFPGGGGIAEAVNASARTHTYGLVIHDPDALGGEMAAFVSARILLAGGLLGTAPETLEPLSLTAAADPRQATFQHTSFIFNLNDQDGAATTAVLAGIIGKTCILHAGFWDSAYADFDTIFTGVIREIEQTERGYRITAMAPTVLLDKVIFNAAKSTLASDIDDIVTSIDVVDASSFLDYGRILIDEEYMTYTSRTDHGTYWTLGGVTRGTGGPEAILFLGGPHTSGTAVTEAFLLGPAHPFDIAQAVMYDAVATKQGLGLAVNDNTSFDAAKAAVGSTLLMGFSITEPRNAMDFLEQEIYKVMGGYPVVNGYGLIGIKMLDAVPAPTVELADAHSLDRAELLGNFPELVTDVTYTYDLYAWQREFNSVFSWAGSGLAARYGQKFPLLIEARGLYADAMTDVLMAARSRAWTNRFGREVATITVDALFSKMLLRAGDDVTITFANLVNVGPSVFDFDEADAEAIAVRHDFVSQRMSFDLMTRPQGESFMAPEPFFGRAGFSSPAVWVRPQPGRVLVSRSL